MRGWCWIVVVAVLAGAQARAAPGNDEAHDAPNDEAHHEAHHEPHDEPHWAALATPLRAGELELLGGIGVGSSSTGPVPAYGLGVRRGITDNLQIAFPLVVTASADLGGVWPRLSLTTGLVGAGYSTQLGVVVDTTLGVAAHFVGDRRLVVVRLTVNGHSEQEGDTSFGSGAGGGFAWRLDDAWSVGMSAGLAQRHDAITGATRSYVIGLGDGATLDSGSVPTVRWLANNVLSLELWTTASMRYVVEDNIVLVGLGAVVTATGHFF